MDWSEYLYYDETSASCLRWKVDRWSGKHYKTLSVAKDSVAGTLHPSGYYYVSRNNKRYPAHKIIVEMFRNTEIPDGDVVDHIDGNSLNSRIDNLRVVQNSFNYRNLSKSSKNKSGQTGVFYDQKLEGRFYWIAYWVDLSGKRKSKSYNISVLGYETAFKLACEYRKKMIEELNALGAGYTERHGT